MIPRLEVFHTPKTMHTKCSPATPTSLLTPPSPNPVVRFPRNSPRRKGNFLESYVDAAILTHFRSLIDVCVLRRCRKRCLFPLWAPAWAASTTFGKRRLLSCNHKPGWAAVESAECKQALFSRPRNCVFVQSILATPRGHGATC